MLSITNGGLNLLTRVRSLSLLLKMGRIRDLPQGRGLTERPDLVQYISNGMKKSVYLDTI